MNGTPHASPPDRTPLDELEALQDDVLAELDRLNERIESVLRQHAAPSQSACSDKAA